MMHRWRPGSRKADEVLYENQHLFVGGWKVIFAGADIRRLVRFLYTFKAASRRRRIGGRLWEDIVLERVRGIGRRVEALLMVS